MNDNQQKFVELFDNFEEEVSLCEFVTGDAGKSCETFGRYELKHTTNEYDFDGQADLTAVYYFNDLNIYVEFSGYYQSYGGTEYESYKFVNPIEKMVIVYE